MQKCSRKTESFPQKLDEITS